MIDNMISDRVKNMRPSATLGMAQAARKLKNEGVDVIALSAGEPDFKTPQSICDVAKKAIDEGKTHYVPVRGTKKLLEAIINKFKRDQHITYDENEVMCTVGAKSGILLALESIINEGDEVIICAPFWVSYPEQVRLCGGIPKIITCKAENNFMPKKDEIKAVLTKNTKAIIINSPNNPSGGVITPKHIKGIEEALHGSNAILISDEIYEKLLSDDATHHSPASFSDELFKKTLVINGVSKAYAMTGWRMGMACGPNQIISAMVKLQGQQTTCLPEFVQEACAHALDENEEIKIELQNMNASYKERRQACIEKLKQLPKIKIFDSKGAFYVWADFNAYINSTIKGKTIKDDIDFAERMLNEAHVACVPGTPFGITGFLRISIASSLRDINEAMDRIITWLK